MKLVRYGAPGREKPGIIGDDGKIRDLSRIVKDIDGAMLASGGLAKIKKANLKRIGSLANRMDLEGNEAGSGDVVFTVCGRDAV